MSGLRFGLSGCGGGLESAPPEQLVELAQLAEQLGFEALWLNEEHVQSPRGGARPTVPAARTAGTLPEQLDEQFNPEPDLAESWTVSPDGRAYTFKLRTGVTWHDGQPFSSADVKFTFDEVLLKYYARTKAGLENVLDGIDTPDASTVVMRFKQPYGPLLQRLDAREAPILPRHIYAGSDVQNNPANLRPVGTGPFKFVEYQKGESVRLVRNERYFKPGLPYLDELIFKIIPQASTATRALEHGEVDYLLAPAEADVARLRQNAGIVVAISAGSAGGSNIFNLRRPPFDKIEVRQAFAYAIDRQQILDQVKFALGKVAASPISSAPGRSILCRSKL